MGLVHHHRHSEYSLLDGTGTSEQYAKRAAELGQPALAQTDHGSLSGALHHIKACEEAGIFPISGVEAYFRPDRTVHTQENKQYWHLVLLAKNLKGWHNLLRLTSEAYGSGFYYKPCVDWDLLERYHEGIFASSACMSGYLPQLIAQGADQERREYIARFRKIFGDDFAIEIMPNSMDLQKQLNVELVNVSNEIGAPVIATVDAHYPYKEWADTQDVVLMMATGQTHEKRKRKKEAGEDVYEFGEKSLYLMSEDELMEAFLVNHPQLPAPVVREAMDNTVNLLDRFEPFVIDKGEKLPRVKGGVDEAYRIIREWCEEGMDRLTQHYARDWGDRKDEYRERLEYELGVLKTLQVLDYFVIVGDAVRWTKDQGVRVGVGRGSASGSLVSFLTRITGIDPIGHGLMFERFINPHRAEMPDIDSDFPRAFRENVKEHLADAWGAAHVANVIAHQTFAPKAALQGVARVFDVPFDKVRKVTNQLEDVDATDHLDELTEVFPDLAKFRDEFPEVWKHATRIESQVKAISKHAGGVVVTAKPVAEDMPTQRGNKGEIVTGWGARTGFNIIDEYGFAKIDVLGIVGLDKQQYALEMIHDRHGVDIDLNELPVVYDPRDVEDDVMAGFREGRTFGVFQFEGRDITSLLKQIQPDWAGDLVAANALWRPGPIGGKMPDGGPNVVFRYAPRKNGKEKWEHWHSSVAPFLDETYGLIAYQEQVMQIVQALGGFTLPEADIVRKSITKWYKTKGASVLKEYKEKFLEGCAERGISKNDARTIWDMVGQFATYGFNKSHACGYALQAYQDMWLKVKYPVEFYAAQLTFEPAKKVPRAVREAQAQGITILPPDINTSGLGFSADGEDIRFGLDAIKGCGVSVVNGVLEGRPYSSWDDFESRVQKRKVNAGHRQALIASGAFDRFGMRDMWDMNDRVKAERELLNVSLSRSDVLEHRDLLKSMIDSEAEFEARPARPKKHPRNCDCETCRDCVTTVGGEVVAIKVIKTKAKKQKMAFVDVAFGTEQHSVTLFPEIYARYGERLEEPGAWLFKGTKDDRGQVVANHICTATELAEALHARDQ